jgi:hypothetical protein
MLLTGSKKKASNLKLSDKFYQSEQKQLYIAEATNLVVLSVGLLPEPGVEANPDSFQVLPKS